MCRRRRARPLAKKGDRTRYRWWSGSFVEGFSGGGIFGEGKGDVLDFGGVFGVCGGLNGKGGGRR